MNQKTFDHVFGQLLHTFSTQPSIFRTLLAALVGLLVTGVSGLESPSFAGTLAGIEAGVQLPNLSGSTYSQLLEPATQVGGKVFFNVFEKEKGAQPYVSAAYQQFGVKNIANMKMKSYKVTAGILLQGATIWILNPVVYAGIGFDQLSQSFTPSDNVTLNSRGHFLTEMGGGVEWPIVPSVSVSYKVPVHFTFAKPALATWNHEISIRVNL